MKTSLLLIGLIMGAGIAGTAQATDATECTHSLNLENDTLASASSAHRGMLSELADMLSVRHTKNGSTTSNSGNAGISGSAEQGYRHQPGPSQAAVASGQHDDDAGAHDSTAAPMSMHTDGDPAPASASSDNPPTLGWQSLLPGSIQ